MVTGNRYRSQGKEQKSGEGLGSKWELAQVFRLGCRKPVFGTSRVVAFAGRFQLAARGVEDAKTAHPYFLQSVLQRGGQHPQPVLHAAAEIDGGGFGEVLGGAGDFSDVEAEIDALRQHLVVEDKIVGVFQQRQLLQNPAAEGAIAGVVFGKLGAQKPVLHQGQAAVGNVLVNGHAAAQRAAAQNAGAQHHVIDSVGHHTGHGGYQQRRVLVIGVHHDDHIGARVQSFAVAGLLVAPVSVIAVVDVGVETQAVRDLQRLVSAVVIHQNADVHQVGQFTDGLLQGLLRVVRGQHHTDALAVDHRI